MAFVDENGKIVVRVVYDGPAMAGKTTNVKYLSSAFRARTQSDVISVDQQGERTRFLDWLKVDTGLVAGRQLSCHFMSVPGQRVLVRRREVLLRLADAVVFVCSAEPGALDENAACYESLLQVLSARQTPIPVLVQLNKQDHPRALEERVIRNALRLDDTVRLSGAMASTGEGVRETAVLALRAAADRIQNLVLENGIESVCDPPGDAQELAAMMRAEEAKDQRSLVEVVLDARPMADAEGAARRREPAVIQHGLRLPHPLLPSGLIWPANDGRDILRRAARQSAQPLHVDDPETLIFDAGMWCLQTKRSGFSSLDAAREGLLQAVRRTLQLGNVAVPNLVLCLTQGLDQAYYLWRVEPMFSTLRDRLDYGCSQGRDDIVENCLGAYIATTARMAQGPRGEQSSYDAALENFSLVGERLFYLRHDVPRDVGPIETQVADALASLELSEAAMSLVRRALVEEFSEATWGRFVIQREGAMSASCQKRYEVAAS